MVSENGVVVGVEIGDLLLFQWAFNISLVNNI
jgi:hypothetical protein